MTRLLCFILVLLVNVGFAEKPVCRCYYQGPYISKIKKLIAEYRETARSHCMNVPSPYPEKEERKYYRKYYEISDRFIDEHAMRYPDIYHNLLLFAEQVNVVRDSRCERIYNSYMRPGWAYNLAEKEEKIAKERKRYWEDASICQKKIDECALKITATYIDLFEDCLENHKNLVTFHDYGMLAYLNNNFEKSLELLTQVVENSEQTEQEDLDAKFYHYLGSVCIEIMAYDKAVKYLSKAIKKDPENKSAYFDRALAYFETGEFDLAINDYLTSEPKSIVSTSLYEASPSFTEALLNSTRQGAIEAAVEFVPSMCHSAYGLGETLWTTVEHPIESTKEFANVCYEMTECVVDYCKNLDWDTVDGYVEQIKTLYERFDQLTEAEKGQLIGYTVGKYGLDIFAGGAAIKGIAALKKLKNINRVCNLEAMTLSTANKEAIVSSALKHASEREAFLKNVKIEWDKQNKHIVGKHNYNPKKSIFEHPAPDNLLNKYSGKGTPRKGKFGEPGYQEIVNFEEFIGFNVCEETGLKTETTWGKIHYSKNGAHIVPTRPRK